MRGFIALPRRRLLPFLAIFLALCVAVFSSLSAPKLKAAPIPSVSFTNVETAPFVGENFNFTARFDNTGDSAGYGPYIDFVVPEHVTLTSMTYLGSSVAFQNVGTFPAGDPSCLTHPYARDVSGALAQSCLTPNPGANVRLYTVKLPFGSFVDTQTAADIIVTASMDSTAPIGVAKSISALGGFYLGTDALDNPTTDPSFNNGYVTTSVTPSVIRLTKQYIADYLKSGSENEILPGPNNRQRFRITADIANGATVSNITLNDTLSAPFSNVAVQSTSPSATTSSVIGNAVSADWSSITGGATSSDAVLDIGFEVPYRDAGNKVIDEMSPASVAVSNTATADGTYNLAALPTTSASLPSSLNIKPIATQKSVAMYDDTNSSGYTPGDTVQYTVDTYVGDYQAVDNLVISDILPDGMTYENGSTATTITANGSTYSSSVTPSSSAGPSAGQTTLAWDFGSEGILRGGCVGASGSGSGIDPDCGSTNNGRTRVRIQFRASINDAYDGGNRVEHGDTLLNTVSSIADVVLPEDLLPAGTTYSDNSSASLTIVSGSFTKNIYAVNGSTTLPTRLQPGDTVTYRLSYAVPSTDFTSVEIDDFLPLPMFSASEVTTFNAADPPGTIPVAGNANFGLNETLYSYGSTSPTLSIESGNVVRFEWPSTHDPSNTSRTIDVLFTVTVSDAAYAPGMFITNQATVSENNIQENFSSSTIQQIELEIPEINISKGAVTSDNAADVYDPATVGPVSFSSPGSVGTRFAGSITSASLDTNPINSDVGSLDGGDIVSFAVVVENNGKGDSYETRIKDTLPTGLVVPGGGLNLAVTDGTGSTVPYTSVGGGSGLFDQGIELTNAINDAFGTAGTNIVVLTYDLEIDSTAVVNRTYTNNAQVTKFTALPAGINYMNNQASYQDSADVTLETITGSKSVTSTSNTDTTGNNVAVAEEITYTLIVTVPEGNSPSATLVDTLDSCLAFTGFDSLTASSGVTASAGSYASILAGVSVANVGGGASNDGRQATLNFGDISNTNSSNGSPETITLVYRAVPVNSSSCARGTTRNNQATLTWDTTSSATFSASDVTIQEPAVTIAKTYTAAGGDAGDTKTVQLVITATSGTNFSPAYNVVATDDLSATGFNYVGNIVNTAGVVPTSSSESGGIVTFTYDQLNPGQSSTVRFDVSIKNTVQANSSQSNTATARYTSMLGTPAGLSTYNALGCERTGNSSDCGTTENDYQASDTELLTINNVQNTKTRVDTSEADSSTSGVLVGEIVRYRLVSRIPEGTQTSYVLRDNIPAGMSFLNDGTAMLAFVSTSSFTSSTIVSGGAYVVGDETTVASVVPTYILSGAEISSGPFNNSTDVDFNLGTITNTDNDASFEYAVVEFNALVRNESTNIRGSSLSNSFSTRINGSAISGTSSSTAVTVQEPNIAISKVVTTAPVDAGDTVTYTITLTNTAGTNVESGYDWQFTDSLNTHLQFDSISNISTPGYVTFDSSGTAGQDVSVVINRIDPGDSVTFRINAIVKDTAPANFIVPNTGSVIVSSLPGTNGTTSNTTGSATPGAPSSTTGEEIYSSNSSANTTLGTPTIDKQSPVAGSEYSIGQTIIYPILINVPEGVVQNVVITDPLPVGLRYESHALDLTGFTGTFVNDPPLRTAPVVAPGSDGEDLVLNFGSISVPGTTGTRDSFVVNVTARITDIPANYEGQTLSNTASLSYTNPNTLATDVISDGPAVVTIREPRLSLTKDIAIGDPRIVGDTLNYTVTVESDGSTTAYEWGIDDTLPSHTTLDGTPACTNGGIPISTSYSVSSGVLSITPNPLAGSSLPVGQTVVCTYSLVIGSSAVAGTTYTNTADADWRNSEASSGFGRVYADAVSTANDGTQDTDTANFTMEVIGVSKSDNGRTTAQIGDIVNYTVTIGAPNATLQDFVVTDSLPAGLIYNNDSSITGTPSIAASLSGPNNGTAPTTVTWDFGDIAHNGTTIVITYTARVANIASNADGVTLANDADMSFTPELGTPQTASASDSFIIREPLLTIGKSNNNSSPRFGQTVEYTLVVDHALASNETAYDVIVTDELPAGMTYTPGSVVVPTGWTFSQTGQILEFRRSSLSLSADATFTYDAELTLTPSTANLFQLLTNTVDLSWTSQNGTNANERSGSGGINDYSDSSSSNVTSQGIDLLISKDDQTASILPTQDIIYELTYQNIGTVGATNVVITETVPDNSVFNNSLSTSGWDCADGSAAGTTCQFNVGSVGTGPSASINFAVTLLTTENILPSSTTDISNTSSIASDSDDGPDADLTNNSSSTTTPLVIADVQVTKVDTIDPVYLDHDYSYVIEITNNGPDTATNIVLQDSLPAGVSYRGYLADTATCTYVDPLFSCTLTSLLSGATESIVVDVTGDTPGNKINTASVSHDQHDPNLANNQDSESTLVDPADLEVKKTVDKTDVTIGDTVTFTVRVKNNGPDLATGVVAIDSMPSALLTIDAVPSKGSCSISSSVTCQLGQLTNGEEVTITIRAKVLSAGSITNSVSTTLNEYDPNPANSTNVGVTLQAKTKLAATGSDIRWALVFSAVIIIYTGILYRARTSSETNSVD